MPCDVQILLQRRGIKLNPITSLYYIAPACFACLSVPWLLLELPRLLQASHVLASPNVLGLLALSAVSAFGEQISAPCSLLPDSF
jgi:hypothetical protein